MSALSLMASGESKWLTIGPDDTVILSSHPIPGNEMNVSKVIDGLVRTGARRGALGPSATSTPPVTPRPRSSRRTTRSPSPSGSFPVHGEYRHLVAHAKIARTMGIDAAKVWVCEDGHQVELTDDGLMAVGKVPAGYLYVDGTLGDVGHAVLRDRKVLAEEGVVVVIVTVDVETGAMLARARDRHPRLGARARGRGPAVRVRRRGRDRPSKQAFEKGGGDIENVSRQVRRAAGRFVNKDAPSADP